MACCVQSIDSKGAFAPGCGTGCTGRGHFGHIAMEAALARHCPPGVSYTRPEGGMFLWLTLPSSVSAMALFDEAIKEKVAFVPGAPFYVRPEIQNTLRLSFSCVDEATTEEGIQRLCRALARML